MEQSQYAQWMNQEKQWIGAYCHRTIRNSFLKVIPATMLLLMLFFGGMAFVGSGGKEGLIGGGLGGAYLGLMLGLVYLLVLAIALRPGRYVQKIEHSVAELAIHGAEREQLAKEMLEALADGSRVLNYKMTGPNSQNTPARVIITPHYVFQEGSTPYSVLVRLSEIAQVCTSSERKTAATRGTQSKSLYALTLYTIGFYRKDRFDRGQVPKDLPDLTMGFFQKHVRDSVASMMCKQGIPVIAASV